MLIYRMTSSLLEIHSDKIHLKKQLILIILTFFYLPQRKQHQMLMRRCFVQSDAQCCPWADAGPVGLNRS